VTLIYFRELLTDLQEVKGEFLSSQQYNLESGKVGERWKGRGEGYGKWVEPADLPTPHCIQFAQYSKQHAGRGMEENDLLSDS